MRGGGKQMTFAWSAARAQNGCVARKLGVPDLSIWSYSAPSIGHAASQV